MVVGITFIVSVFGIKWIGVKVNVIN